MAAAAKEPRVEWGRLNVFVRARPLSAAEGAGGALECVDVEDAKEVYLSDVVVDPSDYLKMKRLKTKRFTYDRAWGPECGQREVYAASTAPLVEQVVKGGRASCFCYGATGAGKTYTMLGTEGAPGVMVLALKDLFAQLEGLRAARGANSEVHLSYMEIYNETVRDLLTPTGAEVGTLCLREDPDLGVCVAGLTQYEASSADHVMDLLQQGNLRRMTESTRCNTTSSRSHAVLQVYVQTEVEGDMLQGKLSLVDLAGSERHVATEKRSVRSLEGANINKSLLALSGCISALVKGQRHVPYRNSKLTQILKDSLGGKCQTSMIANVSPSHDSMGETSNTLHWADRAKQIRTPESRAASANQLKRLSVRLEQFKAARPQTADPRMQGDGPPARSLRASTLAQRNRQARASAAGPGPAAAARRGTKPRPQTARPAGRTAAGARVTQAAQLKEMTLMRQRLEALEHGMAEMRSQSVQRESEYQESLVAIKKENEHLMRQKDELIRVLAEESGAKTAVKGVLLDSSRANVTPEPLAPFRAGDENSAPTPTIAW